MLNFCLVPCFAKCFMWTVSCNSYKNCIGWDYFYYLFKKFKKILLSLFLRGVLGLEQNVGEDIEISHIRFYPAICIASSISNISHKNHTFVTMMSLHLLVITIQGQSLHYGSFLVLYHL